MFRRILIPTDFSTAAEWAFGDAVRIAGASGGELIILHVRMTWASDPDQLRFPADPSLYEYVERQELERVRDRVRRANTSVASRLIVRQAPNPGAEISKVAKEEGVDLIVIATHARHHVAHLFVGSTTMSVLSDPPAPVLAIRYGTRKRTSMDCVVVPVHFGQSSHRALELAGREAREVHLVTVCAENEHDRAQELLRDASANLANAKTAIVRGTDPEEEIIRYASKVDADALFLNAAIEPSRRKIDMIRHAPLPVMIVP
ncbi:MAG TPA: universal stress protein [Thermoanaerobaculia bacterium]|nr:universal stress protein [Thermoanaerobaculia bacterium]